jgi:hypothetical protein
MFYSPDQDQAGEAGWLDYLLRTNGQKPNGPAQPVSREESAANMMRDYQQRTPNGQADMSPGSPNLPPVNAPQRNPWEIVQPRPQQPAANGQRRSPDDEQNEGGLLGGGGW